MPRIQRPFIVRKRTDTKKFIIVINPASGLPSHICKQWDRVSFSNFPPELSQYRDPKTKTVAENGALALIRYLNAQDIPPPPEPPQVPADEITVGNWLLKFTTLNDNPRSARLIAESLPYSPDTIEGYRQRYEQYLKGDPFLDLKMTKIEESDALSFVGRIGIKKTTDARTLVGTRTFVVLICFVRMAFNEYAKEHKTWLNPFNHIKAPKQKNSVSRDIIEGNEIIKLFAPDIIVDPLQKAVCTAMFFAGLRRSEIWGLKPEDLDWRTPRIKIQHAWKRFNSKVRELGDPKCHQTRETIFPPQLQVAIRQLWEANGKHEFVFCRADGSQPSAGYIKYWLPRWLKKAGIKLEGRIIVPHSSRHSFASMLETDGVPLRYIQKILGHNTLQTTRGYLHEPTDSISRIGQQAGKLTEIKE
jgi:integrase/recombinase XerD